MFTTTVFLSKSIFELNKTSHKKLFKFNTKVYLNQIIINKMTPKIILYIPKATKVKRWRKARKSLIVA